MVKVGPAFFDSVSEQKFNRSRGGRSVVEGFGGASPIFFLLLFFSIILVRLFYVEIFRGSYYKNLADQNRTRTEIIAAPRGIIYDRYNRPLVANSPAFKLVEEVDGTAKAKFIPKEEALNLIASGKNVENDTERKYLANVALSHVLGYTGQISEDELSQSDFFTYSPTDFIGKSGLERQYEKQLHGTNGKRLFEVDSRGEKIRELGTQAPIPGENIKTTLDLDVGKSVDAAMEGVARGAVIVSDPRDGGILALYSSPSFDPNIFTHSEEYQSVGRYKTVESVLTDTDSLPLLNRAIAGVYPPGSTFKLVAAAAALERNAISGSTEIDDPGILRVGEFSFGNWYYLQYGRTDGVINVVGAIKRSNDIFFYKSAEATGADNLSIWARDFGLGAKSGIDLPSEVAGTVPTMDWKEKNIGEPWYLGDTYNYGIGQGYLLTTPLQVNSFTEVFANGGTLYQPRIIAASKPKIKNQNFLKNKNIDLVKKGMYESCDTGGVAWPFFGFKVKNDKLLKNLPAGRQVDGKDYIEDASAGAQMARVTVACKTGTAESGGDNDPHSWITVFAPYNNPEIVITVLVENGGEGSSIAGPIAKKILQDYFERK